MISQLFDLTGKTALITGSSQGLGYIFAQSLANAGATVILNGRNVHSYSIILLYMMLKT